MSIGQVTHPQFVAREDQLPIDPSTDAPDGFRQDQRGLPGGIHPDTWFFPEFNNDRCSSGEINPVMSTLLDRAPGRQLDYQYTYTFRGKTSVAHLIIEN